MARATKKDARKDTYGVGFPSHIPCTAESRADLEAFAAELDRRAFDEHGIRARHRPGDALRVILEERAGGERA